MASFFDARDHVSGQLLGSLPCSAVACSGEAGLANRLRFRFVGEGVLNAAQAEQADFEIREDMSWRAPR